MLGLQFVVTAVLSFQQPVVVVPRLVGPALERAQAPLTAVATALEQLNALNALDALDALDALEAVPPLGWQGEQDPTDSLWRAARRAFNRGDYASAANLYGDLTRLYPNSTRAGDALYWSAFALYKNDDLDRARSLLVTQQRRYPKAATLRDADALLARIAQAVSERRFRDARRILEQIIERQDPGNGER